MTYLLQSIPFAGLSEVYRRTSSPYRLLSALVECRANLWEVSLGVRINLSQTAMKRVIAIVFLLTAFETIYSVPTPLSYAVSQSAMFRANLERTGVYKTQGIQRLHGIKWKFKTERVIEAWFSSPT